VPIIELLYELVYHDTKVNIPGKSTDEIKFFSFFYYPVLQIEPEKVG